MATFVMELGGGRELVDEARAEKLLADLENGLDPVSIRLSNKSFDNKAAEKIAQYLIGLSNVKIADISDIIAGRPEEEALRTLKIICSGLEKFHLTVLDVSDNAFGAKGVEACQSLLSGKSLEKLYLCNNGLSAEALQLVLEILMKDGAPPLTLLQIYNNMSGNGGAKAVGDLVKACPNMEEWRFSATRAGGEGCLALAQAALTLRRLRKIDFSDNNFGDEASGVLAEALLLQGSLETLMLRDSGLGSKGVNAICTALCSGSFPHLTHLDLSGNEIDAELAEVLAAALGNLPALQKLYLDDNELGSEGAALIAHALTPETHVQLVSVSCCTCEITARGGYILARRVSKLPKFVTLEMNGNQLVERAVEAIASLFSSAGKILGEMDDNDEDGEDDFEEALAEFEGEKNIEKERDQKDGGEAADDLADALGKATI